MSAERGAAAGRGTVEPASTLDPAAGTQIPQLSGPAVLAVWAAATLPLAAIAWILAPWEARSMPGSNALIEALLIGLAAGLVWQFVVVLVLVAAS